MKKITTAACMLAVLITTFAFNACKKEQDLTYTLTIPTIGFHTNAQPTANQSLTLVDTSIATGLTKSLSSYGVSADKISSVTLKSLTVHDNTAGTSFDPFDFGEVFIKAGSQPLEKFAFKNPIAHTGLMDVSFDSQGAELVDYIKNDNMEIQLKGYNSAPVPAMDLTMDVSFTVKYKVL